MAFFFFDLDGTLTDSRAGLFSAFRDGLAEIGASALGDEALQPFLGAPLPQLFLSVCPGISPSRVEQGIAAFRRSYEAYGIFENRLYPGVMRMLAVLRDNDQPAWVVTSKPQPHAMRVIRLLRLEAHLRGVVGAGLAETDTKSELVGRALAESGATPANAIMLGDRSFDIVGARENGVRPVGALWGYGTKAELQHAGCSEFAASADDFTENFIAAKVPA